MWIDKLNIALGWNSLSLLLPVMMLVSSGCARDLSIETRLLTAERVATQGGLLKEKVETGQFRLTTYHRFGSSSKRLVVYIEGDGFSWVTRNQVSGDPTPINPVALHLASLEQSANVLYIARPCQYVWPGNDPKCQKGYWTNRRTSEEVISSINHVISIFKKRSGTHKIQVVGYSGGGSVAALISARREDVSELITVAGNLNYKMFTDIHHLSPMKNSLDPLEVSGQLSGIAQCHLIGENDRIIPQDIADSFVMRQRQSRQQNSYPYCNEIKVLNQVSHSDGWVDVWPDSVDRVCGCVTIGRD